MLRAGGVVRSSDRDARAERRAPRSSRTGCAIFLQGQKLRVRVESRRSAAGPAQAAEGELLFTQYGLSGTAVLDVSESLSIALNREGRKDAAVVVDLVPFMSEAELAGELSARLEAGWAERGPASPASCPRSSPWSCPSSSAKRVRRPARDPARSGPAAGRGAQVPEFRVQGTRGWNEAEFTSGGVDAREVEPRTLGSKLRKGLYFAGEVLDVQGGRGGYNLAWAWASGAVAGLAA